MRRVMDTLTVITFIMVCLLSLNSFRGPEPVHASGGYEYKLLNPPDAVTKNKDFMERGLNQLAKEGWRYTVPASPLFLFSVLERPR